MQLTVVLIRQAVNGERDAQDELLHDFTINNVLRRLNRQIGTPQKGNHSIRKTCISNMIASKQH